jgi:hypothetical protein
MSIAGYICGCDQVPLHWPVPNGPQVVGTEAEATSRTHQ